MIRISKISDVKGMDRQLSKYIKEKLRNLTEEYQVQTIEEFGVIFVVEVENDLENYKAMGFNEPVSKSLAEYITKFNISSANNVDSAYIEACYIFSDSYGLIVIGKAHFFQGDFSEGHLMSPYQLMKSITL